MTRPRHDDFPEAADEQCREELRERRDKRMFALRMEAYLARIALYASARREGRIPPDQSPPE